MAKPHAVDAEERAIYALICSSGGIKAREIAHALRIDRKSVNRYLYVSPFIRDLCWHDGSYRWHGYIKQSEPHDGLRYYCGWYGTFALLEDTPEDEWFEELLEGCRAIGRSLNDTRGLFHSFRDTREAVLALGRDLRDLGVRHEDWELAFELRIRRSNHIRIYADVLVVAPGYAFSLEFKMKDAIEQVEVDQAAKYAPYLEVVFGPRYEVVPSLVLTRASDLFCHRRLTDSTAEVSVCSADMLFNVFDEYLGFLAQ